MVIERPTPLSLFHKLTEFDALVDKSGDSLSFEGWDDVLTFEVNVFLMLKLSILCMKTNIV